MSRLTAEFRTAFKDEIKAGLKAYASGEECPHDDDSPERAAWDYGLAWAERKATAWRPAIRKPSIAYVELGDVDPDYDVRGMDYETQLVGRITDSIIDADRLARADHDNGFPNFALYRLVLAGDRRYLAFVRQWWVLFSIEWCRNHCRHGFDVDVAVNAAWDSLARTMEPNPSRHPSMTAVSHALGVDDEAFVYASSSLRAILEAALSVYGEWLLISYRVVKLLERKS